MNGEEQMAIINRIEFGWHPDFDMVAYLGETRGRDRTVREGMESMKVYVICLERRHGLEWLYETVVSSKEAAEKYLEGVVGVWYRSTAYSRWESDWLGDDATYGYRWLIFEEDLSE